MLRRWLTWFQRFQIVQDVIPLSRKKERKEGRENIGKMRKKERKTLLEFKRSGKSLNIILIL